MSHPLLEVGVVIGVHGLQGMLRVKLFTADLRGLSEVDQVVVMFPDGRSLDQAVDRLQEGPRGLLLLGLAGIGDRDAAEALHGAKVALRREQLPPLSDGEFYLADLLGCAAVTPSGEPLGTVVEVGDNGAQALLYLEDGLERFHVPAVAPFLRDFDGERLVLDLPDGLREAVAERLEVEP